MQEFHFTVQRNSYSADFVIGGNISLHTLAEFILKTVGFDPDHTFQFCDNLKRPYRSKERYTLSADLGGDRHNPGVMKTRLSAVFRPRRKMIFHFDFGADWFFLLTCTAVKESEAKHAFRKVVATRGTPPVQYPEADLWNPFYERQPPPP